MSCFLSFVRFAAPSARFGFLSFEESRSFIRSYGFRGLKDYVQWSQSGARPAFIPSNPPRSYRDCGWTSWPDWLGYEREVKPPKIPVLRECDVRASEAKAALIDEILRTRPDMEFRELPKTLKASHLFRIRLPGVPAEKAADAWISLQIRFSSPIKESGRLNVKPRHLLRLTADEDTPVVILSPSGGLLLGRRSDFPTGQCAPSDFTSRDAVFERLDAWWAASEKATAADIVRQLRERHDRRGVFAGTAFLNLQRTYLDPLGLSWKRSGEVDGVVNAIFGDRYRMVVRQASLTDNKFYVKVLDAPNNSRSGPASATHEFDFLLVMMPLICDEETLEFFLFPKCFLVEMGVLTTTSSAGRETLHLYPPSKFSRKSLTEVRKEEQAPYFVNKTEKFSDLLYRFGGEKEGGDISLPESTQQRIVC